MMVVHGAEALSALSEASIIEYTGRCLFTSSGCDFAWVHIRKNPFALQWQICTFSQKSGQEWLFWHVCLTT